MCVGEAVLLRDFYDREIRFSMERQQHIERDHPEMIAQHEKIKETLLSPYQIMQSRTDDAVELFYRDYQNTPVTRKYLCVVVKISPDDAFIITAFFTDTVKKGQTLWRSR
jgi:hypothetical protein